MGGLFILLISILTGYKSKIIKYFLISGFLAAAIYNLFSPYGSNYALITEIIFNELPWGEKIPLVKGEISFFFWTIDLLILVAFVYVIRATIYYYNAGSKNEAYFIGLVFSIIIASILFDDFFIETGRITFPMTKQFAFISVIFLTGVRGINSHLHVDKTQRALIRSEEKYRQLTDINFDGVCVTRNGSIVEVNDRFLEMFLLEKKQLLNSKLSTLFTRDTGVEKILLFEQSFQI